jgi:hypothetical protein
MERTKKPLGGLLLAAALFAVALSLINPGAFAATLSNQTNITVKWVTQPLVKLTLTPNYATGFGQFKVTLSAPSSVSHGPNAVAGGGTVDFGDIEAGFQYIYRYAAHVNVVTNDGNGFYVLGEGAAVFTNNNDSTTYPSAVYYFKSTNGSGDSNITFAGGQQFQTTTGSPSGNTFCNSSTGCPPGASINYMGSYPGPGSPSAVANSVAASGDFYYDYGIVTPPNATAGNYYMWVVYTVVAK